LRDSASFPEIASLINRTKIFTFAFKSRDKYFTLTDNILELKVNLEKYLFYMHYSVYSKLLAARIFAVSKFSAPTIAFLAF